MKVKVCIGTSCHLMGAQNLISMVRKLQENQDLNVELEVAECLNHCSDAPAVEVEGEIYLPSTPKELKEIIEKRAQKQNHKRGG
ncbi:NAD(P)H-dependent oxidoreductase subunit E [Sporohalobacter salinus]|uniref:NAD(P)H-dependent oxidoreductase subunit E n=1 Tax=Sporohalobacter salinus TaxID=1494606 RepID=UPI003B82ECEA|nr:NADH-quinone oxidoreductase subunit E [Sporohalobacter salinus]